MTQTFPPPAPPTLCIWINGSAQDAAAYYQQAIPHTCISPDSGGAEIKIGGVPIVLLGADGTYSPNPSISGFLRFSAEHFGSQDQAETALRETYANLGEGGELMPLQAYPFAPLFAWVRDRYGFTWQLLLETQQTGLPFYTPCLMFGNTTHGQCEAATDYWISLLGGQRLSLTRHGADSPLEDHAVQMTVFILAGATFTAMDGGSFHDFTFSPGVSLMLFYPDQAGIDGAWRGLSRVPEAERCGWCLDEWGISWQVLPTSIGSLMAHEESRSVLLSMGKIELNKLSTPE